MLAAEVRERESKIKLHYFLTIFVLMRKGGKWEVGQLIRR